MFPHTPAGPTTGPQHRVRLRAMLADERGSATTELVLAVPLLLLLMMLIAQFALWMHATHIAQATAAHALAATRIENGSVDTGHAEADRILDLLGSGPLRNPHTSITRSPTQASVHVEGTVTPVVPFLALTATGEAVGPVERFRSTGQP